MDSNSSHQWTSGVVGHIFWEGQTNFCAPYKYLRPLGSELKHRKNSTQRDYNTQFLKVCRQVTINNFPQMARKYLKPSIWLTIPSKTEICLNFYYNSKINTVYRPGYQWRRQSICFGGKCLFGVGSRGPLKSPWWGPGGKPRWGPGGEAPESSAILDYLGAFNGRKLESIFVIICVE